MHKHMDKTYISSSCSLAIKSYSDRATADLL